MAAMRVGERSKGGTLLVPFLLLALGFGGGCGVRQGEALGALRSDIQRELRVDANVNLNDFRGKVVVTVTLQARPAGDLDVARERVVAIARSRLPRATRVDVFARL